MRVIYNQRGYIGQSMSVRAAEAYDRGEAPLSKWAKSAIIDGIAEAYGEEVARKANSYSSALLKDYFLRCTGWHHMGKYAGRVDFYEVDGSMDESELSEAFRKIEEESESIKSRINERKKQPKPEEKTVWALVSFEETEKVGRRFKTRNVVAVAEWREQGKRTSLATCYLRPCQPMGKKKLVSSLFVMMQLDGKPRKNAKVWKATAYSC